MIERITIKNFKSFKDVTVKLGPMNIFIGANASGKSNFFDALRCLQGVGYGFTFNEILNGKPKSATSEVWEGIRGGSDQVPFASEDANTPTSFQVSGRFSDAADSSFEFRIAFSAKEGRLQDERLAVDGDTVYQPSREHGSRPAHHFRVNCYGEGDAGRQHPSVVRVGPDRSVLIQMARNHPAAFTSASDLSRPAPPRPWIAEKVVQALADMQRIDPSPALLRGYSEIHQIKRMGEHGENFAALIRMICSDPPAKGAYLSWLRELRPRDVDDVGVLKGALGEPMVMMKERGREWPAPALSDGTLRFAALAAAFFQPDMPGIITIEEIENGIHASRLRLLVELMRSQMAAGKTQVMATTHSPVVLAWLKPEEYATTFCCRRDEETGESKIVSLSEIPRFPEIVRQQPIAELFAEGWLEEAL